jgi:hypothetical protein
MTYLKVKDSEELVRDTGSSAILNTDNDALRAYKAKKNRDARIEKLFAEHEEIKNDLQEIKDLIRSLVGHKSQ